MSVNAGTNWVCPHCDRPQTLTGMQVSEAFVPFERASSKHGNIAFRGQAISCANPDCCEVTISVAVLRGEKKTGFQFREHALLSKHRLRPRSRARHWPDYIKQQLREDYEEACLIADLSPKASATLCRRCLQGMIRDFCGISKPTLDQEIKSLRKLVDDGQAPKGVEPETLDAIDAVRSIGNIGAHMEKDVDIIVGVEPNEAQLLLGLIELLFDEWYVARHSRVERLAKIKALAEEKQEQREGRLTQELTSSALDSHDDEPAGSGA